MKKILVILFVGLVNTSQAQTPHDTLSLPLILKNRDTVDITNISYQFKYQLDGILLEENVDFAQNKINITSNMVKQTNLSAGYKVKALYEKDGYVYYKYWNFPDSSLLGNEYNGKVFRMKKEYFTQITDRLYRRYKGATVGAYTIPFRLRGAGGSNFDFETALSLQANLVFGFGKQTREDSWLDLSWGLGLTKVNLDSDNSDVTEKRTASALTTSVGGTIKLNQYANLGIFLGWDFLDKQDRKTNWIYNKKSWFGVGINVSFERIKTEKTADKAKNP